MIDYCARMSNFFFTDDREISCRQDRVATGDSGYRLTAPTLAWELAC